MEVARSRVGLTLACSGPNERAETAKVRKPQRKKGDGTKPIVQTVTKITLQLSLSQLNKEKIIM